MREQPPHSDTCFPYGQLCLPQPDHHPLQGKHILSVDAGFRCTIVMTDEGTHTFGSGDNGRLGHGDTKDRSLPTLVEALWGMKSIAVAVAGSHCSALTDKGTVLTWGIGEGGGQLDRSATTDQLQPKLVTAMQGKQIAAVSAGGGHSMALSSDGLVLPWGWDVLGQLGLGKDRADVHLTKVVKALRGKHIVSVPAGGAHSVALTTENLVFTWGTGCSWPAGGTAMRTTCHRPKWSARCRAKPF